MKSFHTCGKYLIIRKMRNRQQFGDRIVLNSCLLLESQQNTIFC